MERASAESDDLGGRYSITVLSSALPIGHLRLAAGRRDISTPHDDLGKLRGVVRDYRPPAGG